MLLHFLVAISSIFVSISSAQSCFNRFPLRETVDTIKQLVEVYGKSVNETDPDGTEWINVLMEQKQDGYKLDDITYYLNDNSLPPESTFYFDQLQFLSTPVYVLPSGKRWKPSHPDNTYLLSKISFSCPTGQRTCGLRCCPEANYIIQELFLENSRMTATNENTQEISLTYGDVIYNTKNVNASCSYTFSYHDTIAKKFFSGQELTVYFDCPIVDGCCGLSCSPPPKSEFSRHPRSNFAGPASEFYYEHRHHILLGGCAVFLSLFVLVTTLNYRQHRSKEATRLPLRTSHETQTSTISLEKAVFLEKV